MKRWLRRLRGLLGNSVLWGLAWFAGSTAILGALLMAGALPRSAWSWEIILERTRQIGMIGFGAGVVFSTALPLLIRGQVLNTVGAARFMLAGAALGGLTFLGVVELFFYGSMQPSPFFFAAIASAFGAATAGSTLAAAKHAHRVEVGAAVHELEATQEEARQLLGPEAA